MGLKVSREMITKVETADGKYLEVGEMYAFVAGGRWCFGKFDGVNGRGYLTFSYDGLEYSLSSRSIERIMNHEEIVY